MGCTLMLLAWSVWLAVCHPPSPRMYSIAKDFESRLLVVQVVNQSLLYNAASGIVWLGVELLVYMPIPVCLPNCRVECQWLSRLRKI